MPAAELPGFYYDEEKGKYFKIQANHSSPAGSAGAQYSRQAIQKRGQQQAERQRKEKLAKRRSLSKEVKRPRHISHLTRHLLERVHTGRPQPLAHLTPAKLWSCSLDYSYGVMSWYDGDDNFQPLDDTESGDLVASTEPQYEAEFTSMAWDNFNQHLLVAGSFLGRQYVSKDDFVGTHSYWAYRKQLWRLMTVNTHANPQLSSYSHRNMRSISPLSCSHNIAVYTNDDKFRFFVTEQTQTEDDDEVVKPTMLGTEWDVSSLHQGPSMINQASPRPVPSHNEADVMMATQSGAILMRGSPTDFLHAHLGERQEMLSADWLDANVCLLAARSGDVRLFDARVSESVIRIRHGSAAFQVKQANRHQALVAGIQNRMRLYDLRFSNDGSVNSDTWPARSFELRSNALVNFPEYRNASNTMAPIAVSSTIGAVAIAEPEGGVQLYDLWHGNRMAEVDRANENDEITALAFSNGDKTMGGMAEAEKQELEDESVDSTNGRKRPRGPCLYVAKTDSIKAHYC